MHHFNFPKSENIVNSGILHNNKGLHHYFLHLTNDETKAQRGYVTHQCQIYSLLDSLLGLEVRCSESTHGMTPSLWPPNADASCKVKIGKKVDSFTRAINFSENQ